MDALKDRPPDLDPTEVLMYRRGYSAGVRKYLKANGTPGLSGAKPTDPEEYLVWRQDLRDRNAAFRDGAHLIAAPSALRALTAYRKRRGLAIPSTPVRTRVVKTKLSPADVEAVLAAVSNARMVGTFVAFDKALSRIMSTLGLNEALIEEVHAA